MKMYLDQLDLSMDHLDEHMWWDCWPKDDGDAAEVEATSAWLGYNSL